MLAKYRIVPTIDLVKQSSAKEKIKWERKERMTKSTFNNIFLVNSNNF